MLNQTTINPHQLASPPADQNEGAVHSSKNLKDDPRVGWHGAAGDRVSEWKPKTEGTTGQRGQSGSVEDGWVGRVCCPVSSTGGVEITLVQPSTPDFIRSVPGEWVQTNILVKLIKRTRRPKNRPTGSTVT
ncbi:hypothetical protein PtB15_6B213 [Puccinia triticina]|nr:hypothetical protein PtB15_6B213 [Puccinia triticina]